MWGLVCGQKQCWKVQNEKLCQTKAVNHKQRQLGRLKKGTQTKVTTGLTTGWSPLPSNAPLASGYLLKSDWSEYSCQQHTLSSPRASSGWSLKKQLARFMFLCLPSMFFSIKFGNLEQLEHSTTPTQGWQSSLTCNNCGFSRIVSPVVTEVKLLKLLCTYF